MSGYRQDPGGWERDGRVGLGMTGWGTVGQASVGRGSRYHGSLDIPVRSQGVSDVPCR